MSQQQIIDALKTQPGRNSFGIEAENTRGAAGRRPEALAVRPALDTAQNATRLLLGRQGEFDAQPASTSILLPDAHLAVELVGEARTQPAQAFSIDSDRGDSMRSPFTNARKTVRGIACLGIGVSIGVAVDLAPFSTPRMLPGVAMADGEETFVTGCELYLHGRRVEPVSRDGQSGFLIRLDSTSIAINGLLYRDLGAPTIPAPGSEPARNSDRVIRRIGVTDRAVAAVRRQRVESLNADSLTVDGVARRIGEFVSYSVEHGETVFVAYHEKIFKLTYEGSNYLFRYEDEHLDDPSPEHYRNQARREYEVLVEHLARGGIVLMGRGYRSTYRDPAMFADLRAAISQIPSLARRAPHNDLNGEPIYEPLEIGIFQFLGMVVRDFVLASEEGK